MQNKNVAKLIIGIVFMLTISICFGLSPIFAPSANERKDNQSDFNVDNAIMLLKTIAKEPHPNGSHQIRQVRDYIVSYLKDLGLKPEIQKKVYDGNNLENILVGIKGTETNNNASILVSHYDSASAEVPGAADDGYGVVSLLETARVLVKEGKPLKNDIYLLFTDGEEKDLLGAKAFLESNKELLKQTKIVMNFEARGNKGPAVMFETSNGNKEIIDALRKASPFPLAYSFSNTIYKYLPNDTDFTEFKMSDVKGYNFAAIDGLEAYHTPKDNINNIDKDSIYHYGTYALALSKYYGDLSTEGFQKIMDCKEDAVYFPLTKYSLFSYGENAVVPVNISILVLILSFIVFGMRKKIIGIRGILVNCLTITATAVASLLAAVIAFALIYLIFRPYMFAFYVVGFKYSNACMIAFVAITGLISAFSVFKIMKKRKFLEQFIAVMLIFSLLSILSSVYFMGISYLFTIPLICFMVVLMIYHFAKKNTVNKFIMLFLVTLPEIVLFIPVIYVLYITVTVSLATALTILVSLALAPVLFMAKLIISDGETFGLAGNSSVDEFPAAISGD